MQEQSTLDLLVWWRGFEVCFETRYFKISSQGKVIGRHGLFGSLYCVLLRAVDSRPRLSRYFSNE